MNRQIMKSICLIILFVGAAYATPTEKREKSKSKIDTPNFEKIFSSIGVVSVDYKTLIELDSAYEFTIYNKDGSLYAFTSEEKESFTIDGKEYKYKYDFFKEQDLKTTLKRNHSFYPLEFLTSFGIIKFECKTIGKEYYEIFINKEKGITKFLKKDKIKFKYEPWSKYIFNCYISFDAAKNPLKNKIEDKTQIAKQDELRQYDFKAVEISGEWMRVKTVNSVCKKVKKEMAKEGWIRWRDGNKLLIIMYNDCEIDKPGIFKKMK